MKLRHRIAAVGIATTAMTALVPALPSHAETTLESFRNKATDRCMVKTSTLHATPPAVPCTGTISQAWKVVHHTWEGYEDTKELRIPFSNALLCLEDKPETGLRMGYCDIVSLRFISWYFVPSSEGTITLKNMQTGRCIEDTGTELRTAPCTGFGNQSWA